MALLLRAAVRCDVGLSRDNNEDSFYLDGTFLQKEDMNAGGAFAVNASTDCALFAVCDGMGGEEKGEEASFAAVQVLDALRDRLGEGGVQDVRGLIDEYCARANDAVYTIDGGGKAGSTFVGLCFYEDEAHCASLGDSRLYVLRDGVLTRISDDHTEAARLVRGGVLTPEEASASVYNNIVTNYLGMPPGETPFKTAHYTDFQLHYGDRFLLCSDGLTDMVDEVRIAALLAASDTPNEAVNYLVDAALAAGGRDNVTVLVAEAARALQPDPDAVEDLFGDDSPAAVPVSAYQPADEEETAPEMPDGLPTSFDADESFAAPVLAAETVPDSLEIASPAPLPKAEAPVKLLFDDDSTTLELDADLPVPTEQPIGDIGQSQPDEPPVDQTRPERGLLEEALEQPAFVVVERFEQADAAGRGLLEQSLAQDSQAIPYRDARPATHKPDDEA